MFCWLNVLINKLQHKCHLEEKLTSHADLVQRMWDEYEEKRIMAAAEARDTLPAGEWIGLLLMMRLMWVTIIDDRHPHKSHHQKETYPFPCW